MFCDFLFLRVLVVILLHRKALLF